MPYIGPNTAIVAAREGTRGTKAGFNASSPEKKTVVGVTDRRIEMPDWEQSWYRYKSHGNKREILRQVPHRTDFGPAPMPLVPLDGFMFFMGLGREYTNGTAVSGGGSTTLSANAAAGASSITVTATTNFAVNDLIKISGTNAAGRSTGEVHKISGISGTTLTLATTLVYAHSSGDTVIEVQAPFEHIFEPISGVDHPTFSAQALYNLDDDGSARFLRTFKGAQVQGWELSGEDPSGDGGDLRFEPRIVALDVEDDTSVPSTINTPSFPDVDPYMFYHTAGLVTAFSRTYATIQDFALSWDNKSKTKRYFGASSGQKPTRYLNQFPDYSFRMTIVPDGFLSSHDNTIYDLLRGRTKGDIKIPFIRDGAASYAASGDAVQIELGSCAIQRAPHAFPLEDEIQVPCEIFPTTVKIKVRDSTPMYARL